MGNLLMRRRKRILSSAGDDDISGYVKDGLIIFWDGIYNTANGHNASSALWEDLSGNGHHATYNSANLIGDKYLQTNGRGLRYVALSDSEKTAYTSGMTEIVIEPDSISAVSAILAWAGNAYGNGSVYLSNSSVCFRTLSPYKSIACIAGKHYYNSQLWLDGEVTSNTGKSDSWRSKVNYLASYSNASSYPFSGKIYAFRAYSRVLTNDEILQNWREDQRRFGIGGQ